MYLTAVFRSILIVSDHFRDRRSLGASQRPSGVLVGHTEGITYVSAKGDGRYVVSNGKDQSARLWDLRKMRSSAEFDKIEGKRYGANGFDYRFESSVSHPKRTFADSILDILLILSRNIKPTLRTVV